MNTMDVGKRYVCATCNGQFMALRPGNLPSCCGKPLQPK